VTKTETLLPLDPIVFTPTTFRHTKRLPIRISRPSHKKFHFKKKDFLRTYAVRTFTIPVIKKCTWKKTKLGLQKYNEFGKL
jgi:hypothetical protein